MDDFHVTISDLRQTGHCVRGIKHWMDGHGIDFADFLANGTSSTRLLETNDALAIDVVTKIEEMKRG